MNKKTIFQFVLLVLLLGVLAWIMAQFFKPGKIPVYCEVHPPRISRSNNNDPRTAQNPRTFDVAFGLDQRYELTSVKVVALDEWTTNKQAQPLWHLVSETNSAPVRAIIYGQRIRGMHAAVPGARPQMLQTNVAYRLLIQSGSREGECDFKLPALPQLAR
jgi:hypothetical protein